MEKRHFISGLHSAQTPTAEDAPACHVYKYMLKSIKSDFNQVLSPRTPVCIILLQMINLPERRASSKVWEKSKDFWGRTNLEPGSRGSQHRSRNRAFSLCLYQKTSFKNTHDNAKEGKGEIIRKCPSDMPHSLIFFQFSFMLLSILEGFCVYTMFQEEILLFHSWLVN